MDKSRSFTELTVWRKAHQFVLDVYALTDVFPKKEQFGLTSQLRRAAVSIAANIAEGYSKKGIKDKMRFFNIAEAPLSECKYYLILIHDLKYADVTNLKENLSEVHRLLKGYAGGIARNAGLLTPDS